MSAASPTKHEREPDPFRVTRWSPRVRWRLLPWWARVILVFVAARAVTTVFLLVLASGQGPNAWTGAHPGLFEYSNLWDSRWYELIAGWGYPSELPRTDTGQVAENAWAFMPVYPLIVRVFASIGLGWDAAAVLVALAAGLGAALVFHRLMIRFLEPDRAMFAVVIFCVAPVAPIMQLGYAESLGFLLLATALLLLVKRQYAWLFPIVLVWSFTRPGALAFALTLGLHWIVRWLRRADDPFPVGERWLAAAAAVFTAAAGVGWLVAAWVVTGDLHAYTDTELAWRSAYLGPVDLVPFTAWFASGDWWLGQPWGTIVVVGLIVAFAMVMLLPAVRRLGIDLRLWLVSYALYLLAVFFPQSSTFRILAPMFPLAGALAVPRARWYRWSLVVVLLALQYGWLFIAWSIQGRDWTPP
ncbi:hypothetical protein [Agromyces larvae]|uniref:Integral membrane protein n=1 Tax=Agromyces larvae TaxID=2929802 RepID=A0ABY4C2C0_9MICO|nr:hypothetical protein [Agromyces larvae]UOE45621.1 hypothetical protein MTO99_07700 [Agromyces larvae]